MLLFGLTVAAAEEAKIDFSVDMKQPAVHVGEPLRVVVTVKHPLTAQVIWPSIGSDWKEASVERSSTEPTRAKQGLVTEQKSYWISSFAAGAHVLDTGEFVYRGSDGKDQKVTGPQIKISVKSLLPEKWEALDIRAIKPPVVVVPVPALLALLAFIAAASGIWVWRRKRSMGQVADTIIPRPAHELALEALEALRRENLLEQDEIEKFYVRLSGVVRSYIEGRFRLRAPEMTTEEFLQRATKASELSLSHQAALRDFLAQSDLVKFAKYLPSKAEANAAFQAALRFVKETAPVTPAPPAPSHVS